MKCQRVWLIAHNDADLPVDVEAAFAADSHRRASGEPLAYLLGEREFHGLKLRVTPDVLVPRPDTETLVDWAMECAVAFERRPLRVLDLGTGSGAVVLALAHALRANPLDATFTATDLSCAALDVARLNARSLGLRVDFAQGSWWAALPIGQRFDLVASNPPYIRLGDAHLPALRHEPAMALASGADGLEALRTIVTTAHQRLNPSAWMLLEHGWDQAEAVAALLADAGFDEIATRLDIDGRPRCTGGHWPPP